MFKSKSKQVSIKLCLLVVICNSAITYLAAQQQQQQQPPPEQRQQVNEPNGLQGFLPRVTYEGDASKSRVGVQVPSFVDLLSDKSRGANNVTNSKLDLSVLGGLVTVQGDKERTADTSSGPVVISVFGVPIFSGNTAKSVLNVKEKLGETVKAQQKSLESSMDGLLGRGNVTEMAGNLFSSIRQAEDRSAKRLADSLNRIASFLSPPNERVQKPMGVPVATAMEPQRAASNEAVPAPTSGANRAQV